MKTLFIYSSFQDLPKFFILEGNYSHLDDVIINTGEDDKKETELTNLIYSPEGKSLVKKLDKMPAKELWDIAIQVGFAP